MSEPSPPTMGSILFIIQLYELVASFGAAALFALVACNRGPSLCSLCLPCIKALREGLCGHIHPQ